jgi:hypothetical protein
MYNRFSSAGKLQAAFMARYGCWVAICSFAQEPLMPKLKLNHDCCC